MMWIIEIGELTQSTILRFFYGQFICVCKVGTKWLVNFKPFFLQN